MPNFCRHVALLAVPLLAATPTAADLTLLNHAPLAISELYLSDADDDSWGDNRLKAGTVAPGQTYHLTQLHLRGCKVDLRLSYANGTVEERHGLDACRTHQLTFDASTAVAPTLLARIPRSIFFTNHATRAVVELYVSSAAADDWGEDLVDHAIATGSTVEVQPQVPCRADLRVVFDNRSAEERRDVDVCIHGRLDIRPGWTTSDDLATTGPGSAD